MTGFATSPLAALPSSAPAAARTVFRLLHRLHSGALDVQLPGGAMAHFGPGGEGQPRGAIRLRDWSPCAAALKRGDIGFAESYIEGHWTTPDLPALLKLFIVNREAVESVIYGSWWGAALYRLRHWMNRNSRAGSARNIHAHYDLGNAFYRLWLDETMNYSSALFEGDFGREMPMAQAAKVRRALSQSGIAPGGRLLELGCGWGALAECAAREFGAHVTGITLSQEQLGFARERLAAAGLGAQADLRRQDYRDLGDARFDAIVSIEMFEAVGRAYWPQFFATVRERLAPGGRACIQTITIRNDLFERYARSTDFIQQYVFPGGLLPSTAAFREQAQQAGLKVVDQFAFGADYAETLRRWRAAFKAREQGVMRLGFDARFVHIWEFYLAYCEAAFDTGNTDVVQFTLAHADA